MSEKQFPPSIQKLKKAREKGNIVKTQVVSMCASWWGVVVLISLGLSWVRIRTLLQWSRYEAWKPLDAWNAAMSLTFQVAIVSSCILGLFGLVGTLAQTNWFMSFGQLTKGLEQLKPGGYWRRLTQNTVGVFVGLLRVIVLALVVFPILLTINEVLPTYAYGQMYNTLYQRLMSLIYRSALCFSLIAVCAYGLARWRFMKQNRMSLQELKDEFKESEGDPHNKSAQKQEHRAILFSEIRKRVRQSSVVVVHKMK